MKLIHPNEKMRGTIPSRFFRWKQITVLLGPCSSSGQAATGVAHLYRSLDFAKTHFEGGERIDRKVDPVGAYQGKGSDSGVSIKCRTNQRTVATNVRAVRGGTGTLGTLSH